MKKLKNLKALVLSSNLFSDESKYDNIVRVLPALEWLNYERAEEYTKHNNDDEERKGMPQLQQNKKLKPTKGKPKIDKT